MTGLALALFVLYLALAVGARTALQIRCTGSSGEAAHSGLDTLASVITFFSVRIADRPPDAEHPYGHGRVETLSAVVQGVLLVGTAAWIAYESIKRILLGGGEMDPSAWPSG